MAFIGHRPTKQDKDRFWNSVAFYNYVQESVGFGPRVRPTREMWSKSQQPFLGLLHDLDPQLVVVLGYQLWDNLPKPNAEPGLECKGRPHTQRLPLEKEEALLFGIKHPSAGFSSNYWHPFVQQAIDIA